MTLLELLRQELPKRGGLPPVGVECECMKHTRNTRNNWGKGTVKHTEAERAIDEMVRLSGVSTGAAKILYDAGYRK